MTEEDEKIKIVIENKLNETSLMWLHWSAKQIH